MRRVSAFCLYCDAFSYSASKTVRPESRSLRGERGECKGVESCGEKESPRGCTGVSAAGLAAAKRPRAWLRAARDELRLVCFAAIDVTRSDDRVRDMASSRGVASDPAVPALAMASSEVMNFAMARSETRSSLPAAAEGAASCFHSSCTSASCSALSAPSAAAAAAGEKR
jgi:hypothetical protein